VIVGDINYIHPFREGNGRTQLQYLKQLAVAAAHSLDLAHIPATRWIAASISSHAADYGPMAAAIAAALEPTQQASIPRALTPRAGATISLRNRRHEAAACILTTRDRRLADLPRLV
jgi:fido (protein-threonine AMPylation protein)